MHSLQLSTDTHASTHVLHPCVVVVVVFPKCDQTHFFPSHTQAHGAPVHPIVSGHGHNRPPLQATERPALPLAHRAQRGKARALPTSIVPERGVNAASIVSGIGRSQRLNRVTVRVARRSRRVIMGTTYALTRILTAQAPYVNQSIIFQSLSHSYSVTQSIIFRHCTSLSQSYFSHLHSLCIHSFHSILHL